MFKKEDLYRIVCRPALPKDTADVLELTSLIWEGDDYVPGAWADWLDDTEGVLVVAEYSGRVIGLGKLTHIGSGDWWLEGLRVHPDFEGLGVASRIHDYQGDYWTRYGHGVIRLATSSKREAVHHLCKRSGFGEVGQFVAYRAPANPGVEAHFDPLRVDDVDKGLDFIRGSATHRLAYGLMDFGWQWVPPSLELLSQIVDQGRAWWWDPGAKRVGLMMARSTERKNESRLRIEILACELDDIPDFLNDVRSLAGERGVEQVRWLAPLDAGLSPILGSAGFERDREHTIYIYEKVHPGAGE